MFIGKGVFMKGIICYFSTTGNTKLACEHINSKIEISYCRNAKNRVE